MGNTIAIRRRQILKENLITASAIISFRRRGRGLTKEEMVEDGESALFEIFDRHQGTDIMNEMLEQAMLLTGMLNPKGFTEEQLVSGTKRQLFAMVNTPEVDTWGSWFLSFVY